MPQWTPSGAAAVVLHLLPQHQSLLLIDTGHCRSNTGVPWMKMLFNAIILFINNTVCLLLAMEFWHPKHKNKIQDVLWLVETLDCVSSFQMCFEWAQRGWKRVRGSVKFKHRVNTAVDANADSKHTKQSYYLPICHWVSIEHKSCPNSQSHNFGKGKVTQSSFLNLEVGLCIEK